MLARAFSWLSRAVLKPALKEVISVSLAVSRKAGVVPRFGELTTRKLRAPESASVLIEAIRLLTAKPGTPLRLVVMGSAPALVPALLQVLSLAL